MQINVSSRMKTWYLINVVTNMSKIRKITVFNNQQIKPSIIMRKLLKYFQTWPRKDTRRTSMIL